jgi:hypothetical protein
MNAPADPPVERQAARYFWEQADMARRNGDPEYSERMEQRAADWAARPARYLDGVAP